MVKLHFVTKVTAGTILIALALPVGRASTQMAQGGLGTSPVVSIADAPPIVPQISALFGSVLPVLSIVQ